MLCAVQILWQKGLFRSVLEKYVLFPPLHSTLPSLSALPHPAFPADLPALVGVRSSIAACEATPVFHWCTQFHVLLEFCKAITIPQAIHLSRIGSKMTASIGLYNVCAVSSAPLDFEFIFVWK